MAHPWRRLAPEDGLREPIEACDWLGFLLGPPYGPWRRRAREILATRDLRELSLASASELAAELELTPARAARLVAAFALGRRVERGRRAPRARIQTARAAYEEVRADLRGRARETFLVLLLDGRHRLQRLVPVSEGTLTTSLVHPREVFRPAVRESAAAVIAAHNHPSGDPEPSQQDFDVTARLCEGGRLLGIPLLDHVVVGEHGFVSMRERMRFEPADQSVHRTVPATASAASAAVSMRRT